MNSLSFHPSKQEEAAEIVPLIYSSGPAAFDYVFRTKNHQATDFLAFAFLKEIGEFSYKNHTTVKLNGEIAGTGSVFCGKEMPGFTLAAFMQIVAFYKMQAVSVLYRGLRVENMIQPPKKHEFAIAHLGIKENYRGKGIGSQLIDYLLQHNKITTETTAVLDVTIINPAIELYRKKGFAVVKENFSKLENQYSKVPHHFRMERKRTAQQ
jgi:ribosomal protein S18 acetylase RimI-like enzyme